MLFFNHLFSSYIDFKTRFAINDGGGVTRRNNQLLLDIAKDYLRQGGLHSLDWRYEVGGRRRCLTSADDLVDDLKLYLWKETGEKNVILDTTRQVWTFKSDVYETDDDKGLTQDGDPESVRYINIKTGRAYKMKAGKFFKKVLAENAEAIGLFIPERLLTRASELFATSWKAFATEALGRYELCFEDSAEAFNMIYNSDYLANDDGLFHSCMNNTGYEQFYHNYCKAHAAWLKRSSDGAVMARCVVFDEVFKCSSGEMLRLAERQYATGQRSDLKKLLVDMLIKAGYIDGYKRVGAGCSDHNDFVLNDGTPLQCDLYIEIDCNVDKLGNSIEVPYMDSFKYAEVGGENRMYNNDSFCDIKADRTDGECTRSNVEWSEYHGEYIDADEAIFIETFGRDDYFYANEVVYCEYTGFDYFEDDVVWIDSKPYPNDANTVVQIDGEYYLVNDCCYDELNECWLVPDTPTVEVVYNGYGSVYDYVELETIEDDDDYVKLNDSTYIKRDILEDRINYLITLYEKKQDAFIELAKKRKELECELIAVKRENEELKQQQQNNNTEENAQ